LRAYAERRFKPETMVARHLALYREMIRGGGRPAGRRASWMDPVVRLAIEVYWRRPRRGRGSAAGVPTRVTVDGH
jgi:hypothetical protein